MPAPTISPLPEAPDRSTDSPSEFSDKADSFAGALPTFQSEANAVGQYAEDVAGAVSGIGVAFYQNADLSDTSDSDPGSGNVRFNNATQTSATGLYVDDNDVSGTSIRTQVAKFDDVAGTVKGDLSIRQRADKSKWLIYEVTGITQKSGYTVVTVQNGDGSSGSPFSDADELVLGFTRAGEQGADGADGASDFDWITQTSAYTAAKDERILADTSGGAFTVTLPSSPANGHQVALADPGANWSSNNLTVDGNGNNIEGAATFTADVDRGHFVCVYNGVQWVVRDSTGAA